MISTLNPSPATLRAQNMRFCLQPWHKRCFQTRYVFCFHWLTAKHVFGVSAQDRLQTGQSKAFTFPKGSSK